MYCFKCGKEIGDEERYCPFCGELQPQNQTSDIKENKDKTSEYNIFAMLGLICSLSFVVVGFKVLMGVASIVLGAIALYQIKKEGSKGKGCAIAAIIIGSVEVVISILLSIFIFHTFFSIFDFFDIYHGFGNNFSPFFDGIYF